MSNPEVSANILKLVKAEARRLKQRLTSEGISKCHGHCLDIVSQYYGFKNWNVLSGLINQEPDRIALLMKEKGKIA